MPKTTLIFGKKGLEEVEVGEMVGEGCRDVSRPWLELFGVDESAAQETEKPEIHQQAEIDQQQ